MATCRFEFEWTAIRIKWFDIYQFSQKYLFLLRIFACVLSHVFRISCEVGRNPSRSEMLISQRF